MKKGFTLIEILAVIAILGVISVLSFNSFSSFSKRQALDASAEALAGGLRDARAETLASVGGSQHGVFIEEGRFTLFQGAAYDPSSPFNSSFDFQPSVKASTTIQAFVFQRLTGNSSASGTIDLYLSSDPETKRSIDVGGAGIVGIR